jgi:hypothetical protein
MKDFVGPSKLNDLRIIMNNNIKVDLDFSPTINQTEYYNDSMRKIMFTSDPDVINEVLEDIKQYDIPDAYVNKLKEVADAKLNGDDNRKQQEIVLKAKEDIDLFSQDPSQFHNTINSLVKSGLLSDENMAELKAYALQKVEAGLGKGFSSILGRTMMNKKDNELFSEYQTIADASFLTAIELYKDKIAKAKTADAVIKVKREFNGEL